MSILLGIASIFILACFMGANGALKGVAAVVGSQQCGWGLGRTLALIGAFFGGMAALIIFPDLFLLEWSTRLIGSTVFSPAFAVAVCVASVGALWAASSLGFPVSTTAILLGSTFGAGIVASKVQIDASLLFEPGFALFAACPILAWVVAWAFHGLGKFAAEHLRVRRRTFLAVYGKVLTVVPQGENPMTAMTLLRKRHGHEFLETEDITRKESYTGQIMGLPVSQTLMVTHLIVATLLCFLWGLIEVQKIMMLATLINFSGATVYGAVGLVGLLVGGLFFGKRVGITLSKKMTVLSTGSGLVSSVAAAFMMGVSAISGVPSSLTHSIGGAKMGVGMAGNRLNLEPSIYVLAAWVVTWPVSMALGGLVYLGIQDLL